MNIALLTAGGVGSRMGLEIPKQFIHVNDKPVIIYTLEAFEKHPSIDAIIVVVLEGWEEVLKSYAKQFRISKLKWVVVGGKNGQESIYNGIQKLKSEINKDATILVHDGNRSLISSQIISDSLVTFSTHGSAVAAIPCVEAVFESTDKVSSNRSINRELLLRTQTPHVYRLSELLTAHEEALKKNITDSTASCTLMQALGKKVYFSRGSELNIKITTAEDLELFKAIIRHRMSV